MLVLLRSADLRGLLGFLGLFGFGVSLGFCWFGTWLYFCVPMVSWCFLVSGLCVCSLFVFDLLVCIVLGVDLYFCGFECGLVAAGFRLVWVLVFCFLLILCLGFVWSLMGWRCCFRFGVD